METLGSLCDKLIVVGLKVYHTTDEQKLENLYMQQGKLKQEINAFVQWSVTGKIASEDLVLDSNKVYDSKLALPQFRGEIGDLLTSLIQINCEIWHDVDKSYHPELLSRGEIEAVLKQLAVNNLHRNKCIEAIDRQFKGLVML